MFTRLVANAFERCYATASEEQARMASERERFATLCWRRFRMILRTPLTVPFGQAEIDARLASQ
ncbi:hypothetical protein ACNKHX_03815 [Shigella flexneri]